MIIIFPTLRDNITNKTYMSTAMNHEIESKFNNFMKKHKVYGTHPCTHVSMGHPRGKFYIHDHEWVNFHILYDAYTTNIKSLHVAEMPIDIAPFIIDLDFSQSVANRQYTDAHIQKFITICDDIIQKYYIINNNPAYIFKKHKPTKKTTFFKDGIHIIYPDIKTSKKVREIMIGEIIEITKNQNIFGDMALIPGKDIVDKAALTVPWLLYKSHKEGSDEYFLSEVYTFVNNVLIKTSNNIDNLSRKFSIRKFINDTETPLNIKIIGNIPEEIKNIKLEKTNKKIANEMLNELINIMSDRRASQYCEWIRVGWALKNCNDNLFDVFVNFSKKTNAFDYNSCVRIWNGTSKQYAGKSLSHESILYWAKIDNEVKYLEIMDKYRDKVAANNMDIEI